LPLLELNDERDGLPMKYKTDLHCHTSEFSGCAHENAADTIEKYIKHGYTSIAMTNHFEWGRLNAPMEYRYRYDSYEEFVDKLYNSIEYIRDLAGDRINILTGFELCHRDTDNDFLIYGLTRQMVHDFDFFFSPLEDVHDYVRDCGGVMIKAHPMRFGMVLINPHQVDGYEIYNSSKDALYLNPLAKLWVDTACGKDTIRTAGNDHHNPEDIPTAGILTDKPITTDAELIRVLKEKDFEIFHPPMEVNYEYKE